jgi:hypothetical protein
VNLVSNSNKIGTYYRKKRSGHLRLSKNVVLGCRTAHRSDSNLKAEVLYPVISKGFPREEDFKALHNLASTITEKHKEHGFE